MTNLCVVLCDLPGDRYPGLCINPLSWQSPAAGAADPNKCFHKSRDLQRVPGALGWVTERLKDPTVVVFPG